MARPPYLCILFVCVFAATAADGARLPDMLYQTSVLKQQINNLPGLKAPMPSRQFSGYIPVDSEARRRLFYWLIESETSPDTDPVVLWLTGGPGCSSMDALVYEHGPFTFSYAPDGDIQLKSNALSWSKAATMIYVDSPAGTGMSYSDVESDYTTDDTRTVDDLYTFLQGLLDAFPALRDRDLYVAGESYAGVYVPLLCKKILHMNGKGSDPSIRLQGYMEGNPVTDDVFDYNGQPEFAYGMGLIDPPTYNRLQLACRGSYWNATHGTECGQLLHEAFEHLHGLNPYDILDDCYTPVAPAAVEQAGSGASSSSSSGGNGSGGSASTQTAVSSIFRAAAARHTIAAAGSTAGSSSGNSGSPSVLQQHAVKRLEHVVACADRRIALEWLNRDDVREAIHAAPPSRVQWQPCSDIINYDIRPAAMIPVHRELLRQGLRALIYSGDHDFMVPFTGTRAWVYSMGLDVEQPFSAWTIDGQVAGFAVHFKQGLTFATVKGAGHMVPQSNPSRGLHLITRFLYRNL